MAKAGRRHRPDPRSGNGHAKQTAPVPRLVSIEVNGRTYNGKYVVEGDMITVTAFGQSKTKLVGRLSAEDQARRMLAEIVRECAPTAA